VLHYVEQRPLKEIGAILGVPTGTVKWRLWNARRALERALKAEER
jgi:DNA-directed RNA polymerase specialized sigma24 family protein